MPKGKGQEKKPQGLAERMRSRTSRIDAEVDRQINGGKKKPAPKKSKK